MKKIILLSIIVLSLIITDNVLAKTNDTMFISRIYPDVFAVQNYKAGGQRMYKGQIYYMTKGNKTEIGYCIELGANLDTDTYSSTADYTKFNLTKNQADYLKLVAYYGYEYEDHYDRFYYFAAQEIIWEYLTGDEIYWVATEDYNASKINLDNYKQEILNLVNKHNITPKFNKNTINYQETIELIDSNNILEEYKVINVTNATYKKIGNKLSITSTNFDNVEITLARNINRTNDEMFYYAKGSQSIVSTGFINNNQIKYTLTNNGINLKVNKKDYDTKENIKNSNVGFKIYDINNSKYLTDDEYIVNDDGFVIIPNIKKGNYRLEEVDLGIDNYLYNEEPLEFSINENTNFINDSNLGLIYNIDFYNHKPTGKIDINKKGEEFKVIDNNYTYQEINLADVTFEVITKQNIKYNDIDYQENDVIDTIKTNQEGLASIDNLPLGTYIIKEKYVNPIYELDTNEYEINLNYIDAYTSNIYESLTLKNYLKKAKLEISKVDSQTNAPLKGVNINVYDDNDRIVYAGTTNEKGKLVLNDLVYGNYYVKEIKTLDNYKLNNDKFKITLDDNNKNGYITIKNNKLEMPPKTSNKSNNYVFIILITTLLLIIKYIILKDIKSYSR